MFCQLCLEVQQLILAPYFMTDLSDTEAFCRINEWLLKCSKVRKLEPSVAYFDDHTRRAIERARNNGIKSLKFQNTAHVLTIIRQFLFRRLLRSPLSTFFATGVIVRDKSSFSSLCNTKCRQEQN
jgi:hypothetical protein